MPPKKKSPKAKKPQPPKGKEAELANEKEPILTPATTEEPEEIEVQSESIEIHGVKMEVGGQTFTDPVEWIEACKKAGHTSSIKPDGTLDGPEDAPVFVGLPYVNADDTADMTHPELGLLKYVLSDTSGRHATKCAVFIRA
jgi:hypothetical protein